MSARNKQFTWITVNGKPVKKYVKVADRLSPEQIRQIRLEQQMERIMKYHNASIDPLFMKTLHNDMFAFDKLRDKYHITEEDETLYSLYISHLRQQKEDLEREQFRQ